MPVYDALLLVSFGGPESMEEVIPFLETVLRGRNVPRERMLEVAEHYYHFGGRSPINDQNRALIRALGENFNQHGLKLPIYWGNRNSKPFLAEAVRQMRAEGVRSALALVTSAFGSYSGCRQYLQDICQAQAQVGEGAPRIDKIRTFFNHPDFIDAVAQRVNEAYAALPERGWYSRPTVFRSRCRRAALTYLKSRRRGACRASGGARPVGAGISEPQRTAGSAWLEPDINVDSASWRRKVPAPWWWRRSVFYRTTWRWCTISIRRRKPQRKRPGSVLYERVQSARIRVSLTLFERWS